MSTSLLSTVTDAERRVLQVLDRFGSATRAEVVAAAGLPEAEAENSLDTLWSSGFVGCVATFFAASGGPEGDDRRFSLQYRGRAALQGL